MDDTLPGRARRSVLDIAWRAGLLVAVLAAAGLLVEAWAPPVDDEVSRWAAGAGGRTGEVVSLCLSRLGDVPGVVVALVVALAVARRRGRWCDLSAVAVAGTVELVAFLVVSEVVRRDRPPVASPDAAPFTGAFPSGHTAVALAVFGALALLVRAGTRLRRGLLGGAVLMAVLVGAARVVRGQHRPSEVLAGLVLGAGALSITVTVARLRAWAPDTSTGEPVTVGPGSGPPARGATPSGAPRDGRPTARDASHARPGTRDDRAEHGPRGP